MNRTTVGEIAFVKGGKRLLKGSKLLDYKTKYPYLRVTDFYEYSIDANNLKYLSDEDYSRIRRYSIDSKDVYISIAGSTGIVGMVPDELRGANLTENAAKLVIKNSDEVDARFLMYQLSSEAVQKEIRSQTFKNAQPKLALSRISILPILLPDIDEQKSISFILSTTLESIKKQKKLVTTLIDFKKSILHHLFTKGAKGEMTKITEVGEMPESWDIAALKSLVPDIEYGVSQAIPKNKPEHGYKIVSTADITKSGDFLYDQLRYIEVKDTQAEKLKLQDGDVLFNWRNSLDHIGKTTIYQDQGEHVIFASFILRLRCDEKKAHNRFIANLMNYYREKEVFSKLARRAVNQANYNRNEIYVLQVPSPSYEEQVKIADIIEKIDIKIRLAQRKLMLQQQLFSTLLHELMSGERGISS